MKGIEPSSVAWKATALPLSYTRARPKLARPFRAAKLFLETGDSRLPTTPLAIWARAASYSIVKTRRLSLVIFILSLTSGARGDLTITQKVEGAGPVTEMTMKIKGDKARVDPNPQMTTIIDSKSGEMLNLMNAQKKFMRIPAAQAKAVADMAMKSDSNKTPVEKAQLKATGHKETILGYEAEEYTCESPLFKATYWISTTYPNAQSILKQMQAMTPQSWNVTGRGMPDYHDFPGLPLRSKVTIGGKEITSTLVAVKEDALNDADFSVPKDFEEMKLPDMGALLGGKLGGANPSTSPK